MANNLQVQEGTSLKYLETIEQSGQVHRTVMAAALPIGSAGTPKHTTRIQLLDTVGDGTGVTNHAVDYSSALDEIMITPGASDLFLRRLVVAIADQAPSAGGFAGIGASLGSGIEIQVRNGSGAVIDITGGDLIIDTEDFLRLCSSSEQGQFGSGTWFFRGTIDFEAMMGHMLHIDQSDNQFLTVRLHDDFSGLLSMRFQAFGLQV